jgi:hypothetical protein
VVTDSLENARILVTGRTQEEAGSYDSSIGASRRRLLKAACKPP